MGCCGSKEPKMSKTERQMVENLFINNKQNKQFFQKVRNLENRDIKVNKKKTKEFFDILIKELDKQQSNKRFYPLFVLHRYLKKHPESHDILSHHVLFQNLLHYEEEHQKLISSQTFSPGNTKSQAERFYLINNELLNNLKIKKPYQGNIKSFEKARKSILPKVSRYLDFEYEDLNKIEQQAKDLKIAIENYYIEQFVKEDKADLTKYEIMRKCANKLRENELHRLSKDEANFFGFKKSKEKEELLLEEYEQLDQLKQNFTQFIDQKEFMLGFLQMYRPDLEYQIDEQKNKLHHQYNMTEEVVDHISNQADSNFSNQSIEKEKKQQEMMYDIPYSNYDRKYSLSQKPSMNSMKNQILEIDRQIKVQNNNRGFKEDQFNIQEEESETDGEDDLLDDRMKSLKKENEEISLLIEAMESQKEMLQKNIQKQQQKIQSQSSLKQSRILSKLNIDQKLQKYDLENILKEKEKAIEQMQTNISKLEDQYKEIVLKDTLDREIKETNVDEDPRKFLETTIQEIMPDRYNRSQIKQSRIMNSKYSYSKQFFDMKRQLNYIYTYIKNKFINKFYLKNYLNYNNGKYMFQNRRKSFKNVNTK